MATGRILTGPREILSQPVTRLPARHKVLAFRELEALTGLRLTVLLTFYDTRVTRKHLVCFEWAAEVFVEFHQGAGDTHADRFRLALDTTTCDVDFDVVNAVVHVNDAEWLGDAGLKVRLGDVLFVILTVDGNVAVALGQVNACNRCFTSPDGIDHFHFYGFEEAG